MYALITGANRGIGLALVTRYAARADAHVFAVARDPAGSEELAEAVGASNGRITAVAADLATADAGDTIATIVGEAKLDLVINNAGVPSKRGFGELTQDDLVALFKVNTFAPLLVTQAVREKLAPKAKIVNITSVIGSIERAGSDYLAYGASKAALNMLTKKLALELTDANVLALHPGWVRTRMGGDDAAISVDTSADGMVRVIDALDRTTSGSYLAYDGSPIPW